MRVRIAAVLACVAAAVSAPAGAAPSGVASEGRLPDGWISAAEPQRALRDEIVRAPRGAMSPEDLFGYIDERLTTPRDRGGSGLLRVRDLLAQERESHSPGSNDFAFPVPAGDLDGDGLDDLITVEGSLADESAYAVSRKGSDGSVLSEVPLPFYGYAAIMDVNGDARNEILSLDIQVYGTALPLVVLYHEDIDVSQYLAVHAPADGTMLWENEIVGHVTATELYAVAAGLIVVDAQNLILTLGSSPDATGDGETDAFVQVYDIDGSNLWTIVTGDDIAYDATSRGLTLNGDDGTVAATVTTVRGNAGDYMFPIPDTNGDALADIVAVSVPVSGPGTIELYPAAGGVPYWVQPTTEVWGVGAYPASLGPDASSDVVFLADAPDPQYGFSLYVRGYDGETGSMMFHRSIPSYYYLDAGDLDGDGGLDFFQLDWVYESETESSLVQTAFSGEDGADIWQRTLENEYGYSLTEYYVCDCTPDLDGDGALDLLETKVVAHFDEEAEQWLLDSIELSGISGVTGSSIWTTPVADFDDLPYPVAIAPDVTGNGTDDLASYDIIGEPGAYQLVVHLTEGSTGAAAWDALRVKFNPNRWYAYWFGADVAGDGAAELVMGVEAITQSGDYKSGYEVHTPEGVLYGLMLAT